MQRMISILTLLVCLTLLPVMQANAWFFGDDTLVTIDGEKYSTEDFKRWWSFWKEKDEALPSTPQPYIEWLLLKQEGERMDLANAPGFKRQERIFLQSRGLLMLKYESVDSQIDVTDAETRARYEEKYAPNWLIQRMQFANEETALAAWQKLSSGELTPAELAELAAEQGGPVGYGENWMRPKDVDPGWVAIFGKTAAGTVVDPAEHKNGNALYLIKERKEGSDEDFAKFKDSIAKELWKEEEDQLTAKLIRDLIEKYQVKIDEERLAAIDLNAPDNSFSDEPVITTSVENVSEKQFMAVVQRLLKTRPTANEARSNAELAQEFKEETARNIVAQSVTNWESIDRHFEKKEPFKWSYEFNYGHRLVTMLEQQMFKVKNEATDAELAQYYQDNIKRYTVPAQATLYIVDETQGPIDKIWADVAVGKLFQQVVKEYLGHMIKPVEAPINHLDPEVKDVVNKLANGETSQIFKAQGDNVMVHLVERTPEHPLPLEKVKDTIRSEMQRESFYNARNAYLQKLRENSTIEVKESQWKSIQKELGGA